MEDIKIDLHIHSSYSKDGEIAPKKIVEMAKESGISVLSIADHERDIGVKEAKEKGDELGIEVIPAAEMFAQHKGKLFHILSYGMDDNATYIEELYKKVDAQRKASVEIYFKKMKEAGLYVNRQDAFDFAGTDVPLASAYAYAVLKDERNRNHPYVNGRMPVSEDIVYMSRNYFTVGKPLFGDEYIPTSEEVINIIYKSKAIPVLAHPGYDLKFDETWYIDELREMGVVGLETYYFTHSKEQVAYYREYCKKYKLIETCGSDFHGKFKPKVKLGAVQSEDNVKLVKILKETIEKYK